MTWPQEGMFADPVMEVLKFLSAKRTQDLVFTALVLVVGGLLLFADLADVYLWQDEAETALIARHLLGYGLPLATDGVHWVQQAPEDGAEFSADYIWTYHPWLQYLLAAASFATFGVNTFAARFPFALAGLATLLALHRFVSRWLQDGLSARVAGLLLLLCVPFLILARQCRYYSLSALFTLLTVDSYLWLRSERDAPWALPYFVLSAVLLFHSFYAAFFPTLAALVLHMLLCRAGQSLQGRGRRGEMRGRLLPSPAARLLLALVLVALLTLPWTCLIPVWRTGVSALAAGQSTAEPPRSALQYWLEYLGQYFLHVTLWLFPLILMLAGLVVWQCSRRGRCLRRPEGESPTGSERGASLQVVGLVIVVNLLALSALDYTFFRYLTHLIPLLLALLAMVVAWFIERWPMAGYALLLVLVTSNVLHILPYVVLTAAVPSQSRLWTGLLASPAARWIDQVRNVRLRSEIWMYGQELTHPYLGPNEGLVAYLSVHAAPGQTVLVNYEDLPLQFYTDLRVLGGLAAHGLTPDLRPDWVIDRKGGPYRDLLADILAAGSYERITIGAPDIRWENREEARQHHYLTVQDEDPVVLYRRRGD